MLVDFESKIKEKGREAELILGIMLESYDELDKKLQEDRNNLIAPLLRITNHSQSLDMAGKALLIVLGYSPYDADWDDLQTLLSAYIKGLVENRMKTPVGGVRDSFND